MRCDLAIALAAIQDRRVFLFVVDAKVRGKWQGTEDTKAQKTSIDDRENHWIRKFACLTSRGLNDKAGAHDCKDCSKPLSLLFLSLLCVDRVAGCSCNANPLYCQCKAVRSCESCLPADDLHLCSCKNVVCQDCQVTKQLFCLLIVASQEACTGPECGTVFCDDCALSCVGGCWQALCERCEVSLHGWV